MKNVSFEKLIFSGKYHEGDIVMLEVFFIWKIDYYFLVNIEKILRIAKII